MRKLIGLLVLLALACAGQPARLRLATWNLHNLFDEVDDPSVGDLTPSPSQVTKKLNNLGQALQVLGADVLAVQEVENRAILERLARANGYRYAILVEGNDTARGIDVGLLSKVKVTGYASHREDRLPYVEGAGLDSRFSRDCLEVHLRTPEPVVMLVNHFKSKVGKGKSSDCKRRAQAQRVAQIARSLAKRWPRSGLVVVGDLNDTLESWPLEPLARSGLFDPFATLAPARRQTLKHRGQGVALDQMLINGVMRGWLCPGSAQVGHDRVFRRCSDHCPMWADFDV